MNEEGYFYRTKSGKLVFVPYNKEDFKELDVSKVDTNSEEYKAAEKANYRIQDFWNTDPKEEMNAKAYENYINFTKERVVIDSKLSKPSIDLEQYKSGTLTEINGTKVFQKADGTIINMLDNKEYKARCKQQFENTPDLDKNVICGYIATPQYAWSGELNACNNINIEESHGRVSKYLYNMNPDNIISVNDRNKNRAAALEEYKRICTNEGLNPDKSSYSYYSEEKEILNNIDKQIMKKYGLDHEISEYASDYATKYRQNDIAYYSDEQMKTANEYASKLKAFHDEENKIYDEFGYGSKEHQEHREKYKELSKEACRAVGIEESDNYSYAKFETIANQGSEMVYKEGLGDSKEMIRKGDAMYITAKDILDRDYTDVMLEMQPTLVRKSIEGIKTSNKEFDDTFKKYGIPLEEDTIVFRRGRETRKELEEGFTMYGHVSTSAFDKLPKKMPSGLSFGDNSYYIILPKGLKVLYAENVIGYNDKDEDDMKVSRGVKRQHEITLPRNMHFERVGYDYKTDSYILVAEELKYED